MHGGRQLVVAGCAWWSPVGGNRLPGAKLACGLCVASAAGSFTFLQHGSRVQKRCFLLRANPPLQVVCHLQNTRASATTIILV